ncbi:NAD-dependent malic enzyme [Candidatus Gottesmanbacteria bacterium CG11_big_fil_rev_8_21_14_0_20_37_11]|uniref:NAD-dependent malic enzyme n=3 Tax=Candidatus Gottesmaniibacteriota TaxID=1752720 RepID=A0A2M7RQJ0_9BACT|nr:MAG: NAD-dependent malic enzyme [Candidatus Gottesmanbacteria bacterium CG1_02_37_22]PIP32480.1 MAG: NAD-dependent malic enzyme [Candidatus Gottesmanbacteria bacterium CG23_combo_of_CG06-09_8_20_14_all_37_19]PIR08853.1 MAG: NAD-dependent malic enzyme [Candidatus Gottesmanbacteria bacterium CG11_big_fil_rev_8_21_14_0_20_37_11]PIZ02532.1 MAG: NAD-dependent malic enzyme [Candidatus Gottesmanbacteria bacterium CG_4_10_14_0_8_um_filter_37_24]
MTESHSSFRLHQKLNGKIYIKSKVKLNTRKILSLLYTPGVADIVKYIKSHQHAIFDLTIKKNTVAVISDGSAVLGLGNAGADAALPVMEGKCAIFNEFASINAFPICLKTQNTDEIIFIIKNISPVFGAINLEDISAPRCFEIEKNLQTMDIPVMHDDQHATAIAVLAGLLNATKIVGKKLQKCKTVIVGCGAAGTAISYLLNFAGIEDIIISDSQGIISGNRIDIHTYKKELLDFTNKRNLVGNISQAVINADILIGVSVKGIFTKRIIKSMNKNPIVFALANPEPELNPVDAKSWGVKVYASGRSDYRNQINNALVFPGFFKGLLESKNKKVTFERKIKAAMALASIVKHPTPGYFIPSIFNKCVVPSIERSIKE